jgi:hypothetical protein
MTRAAGRVSTSASSNACASGSTHCTSSTTTTTGRRRLSRNRSSLTAARVRWRRGEASSPSHPLTSTGTVGTRPIPKLAHPLWGWRDCTACHANDRLVAIAPGHSGLHKDDCLVCHQAPDAAATESAAPRPHHIYSDKPCISCHGKEAEAPLPTDMEGRSNCWVCHSGTEFSQLFGAPEPSPAESPGA